MDGAPAIPAPTARWVLAVTGAVAFDDVAPLPSASAVLTRCRVRTRRGASAAFVLREHRQPVGLRYPCPDHEALVLRILDGSPVPSPRLVAVDVDAGECEHPSLLMEWMPGDVRLPADLEPSDAAAMAGALATLQDVPAGTVAGLPVLRPRVAPGQLVPPRRGMSRHWDTAFAAYAGFARRAAGSRALAHGDFHAGNLLWSGRRVSAVVDWMDAGAGPRGFDVARCTKSLALRSSPAVTRAFVRAAADAMGDGVVDPVWLMIAIVDGLPFLAERDVAAVEDMLEAAVAGV